MGYTESRRMVQEGEVSGGPMSRFARVLALVVWLSSPAAGIVITEIHYHPAAGDEALEFIEVANDTATPEDISGYAFVEGVRFTFPAGTILEGNAVLVVCADVEAIRERHGIDNALGNWDGRLDNGGERLTLVNHVGIELQGLRYSDRGKWPAGADGTGHTLMLRDRHLPTREPESWTRSPGPGGSPGLVNFSGGDAAIADPVVFNELFRGGPGGGGWVELHNPGAVAVDLSGFRLVDGPSRSDAHVFPEGTGLAPGGFLAIEERPGALALAASEVHLVLLDAGGVVVTASVFDREPPPGATAGDYAEARFPDGGRPGWVTLTPTRAAANRVPRVTDIVINEIHYHPPEGRRGEFIELFNRGAEAIDLSGFRFDNGVEFTFPDGSILEAGRHAVVAEDPAILEERHGLSAAFGPFVGRLANDGENIRLIDRAGNLVDEVRYWDGGRWPLWADGKGASLELIDPRQDNDLATAWDASDESDRTAWERLSFTVPDHVPAEQSELHLYLPEKGICLVDDVFVRRDGQGDNMIPNPGFETDTAPWLIEGTHIHSSRTVTDSHSGVACLRVVATGKGDSLCNRIETDTTTPLTAGRHEVSLWARWVRGSSLLIVHGEFTPGPWGPLSGNTLGARLRMTVPPKTGTPGAENTARRRLREETGDDNLGPVIGDVRHHPPSPAPGAPVTVTARVADSDGVEAVSVVYRVDSDGEEPVTVTLHDDGRHGDGRAGDGLHGGEIPGVPARTRVVFHIEARDARGATRRFPVDAAESLVYMAERDIRTSSDFLRIVLDRQRTEELERRRLHSNDLLPGTLVYRNESATHGVGVRYRGSPWGRPLRRNYRVGFPKDSRFHRGRRDINLSSKGGSPNEGIAYFLVGRNGTPAKPAPTADYSYAGVLFNGTVQGTLGVIQTVDGDFIGAWYGEDAADDAVVLKAVGRMTFDDGCHMVGYDGASLIHMDRRTENYRGYWYQSIHQTRDTWEPFFELTRVMDPRRTADDVFDREVENVLDVEAFLRVLAPRVLMGEGDVIFISSGHNGYLVRDPRDGLWELLPFDLDGAFGTHRDIVPPDRYIARLLSRPAHRRTYLRIIAEFASGYWSLERLEPFLDAIERNNRVPAAALKPYITVSTDAVEQTLRPFTTIPLRILTGDGGSVTTESSPVTLQGEAPVQAASLLSQLNGGDIVALQPRWTSATEWRASFDVPEPVNRLELFAFDGEGVLIGTTDVTVLNTSVVGETFIRGDASGDGTLNITDPVVTLFYLFRDGATLRCQDAADADDSGAIDIDDPLRTLNHFFRAGQPPAMPFPTAGVDPTPDGLGCRRGG